MESLRLNKYNFKRIEFSFIQNTIQHRQCAFMCLSLWKSGLFVFSLHFGRVGYLYSVVPSVFVVAGLVSRVS